MVTSGQSAAGVTVPDTKLASEATELVRESATDLVYHHSRRVFWFGSLRRRPRRDHRPAPATGLQAPHPAGVHRRHGAQADRKSVV